MSFGLHVSMTALKDYSEMAIADIKDLADL
jgi:hypothetical protein